MELEAKIVLRPPFLGSQDHPKSHDPDEGILEHGQLKLLQIPAILKISYYFKDDG